MFETLIFIVITSFLALLILNVYFRVKVFGVYKKLVQNRVDFDVKQLLNAKRLEEEVIPHYPQHREDILSFSKYIRQSFNLGVILVLIIAISALILHFYRD